MTQNHGSEQDGMATADRTASNYRLITLGRTIREARHAQRLSLQQLAARSGVSGSMLSQIERGRVNPSYVAITRLIETLGIPVGSIYQGPAKNGNLVVKAAERKVLSLPTDGLIHEALTPDFEGPMVLLRSKYRKGFDNRGRPASHAGQEIIHVLAGRLQLHLGNEQLVLEAGDSITFDSRIPHAVRNPFAKTADVITALTPSPFLGWT
jgi:transcriptional regulator with XRE-family HTH domain